MGISKPVMNILVWLECIDAYKNKAEYTAKPVACGWAGAEMQNFQLEYRKCQK